MKKTLATLIAAIVTVSFTSIVLATGPDDPGPVRAPAAAAHMAAEPAGAAMKKEEMKPAKKTKKAKKAASKTEKKEDAPASPAAK